MLMPGHASPPFSLYTALGERKYLNAAERRRALAAMTGLPPERALFALTLAWSGARVSEVLALGPCAFQIEACLVSIATMKRRAAAVREVPIPPDLMRALDHAFGLRAAQRDPELAQRRLWRFSRVTAWRIVKQVMARAGIAGAPASPKGFRHAFGMGTLHAGVPINLVQRWLGHARISTTAIYASASGPEELQFAARFWQSAPPGECP
jgi:integrase